MSPEHKIGHSRIVWLVIVLIVLGCVHLLWRFEILLPLQVESPISWHGIMPGHTTVQEAFALLGPSDTKGKRNVDTRAYNIYAYVGRYEELSSQIVELWTEERANQEIVIAIFRRGALKDISSLKQLVGEYKQPDKVSWHYRCGTRFLVWSQKGIGAQVFTYGQPSWGNPLGEILLFEPMSLDQFMQMPWPYYKPPPIEGKIFLENNPCNKDSIHPDIGAEDPYDWEHMPTLPSTSSP
jgi:hypothetical protein